MSPEVPATSEAAPEPGPELELGPELVAELAEELRLDGLVERRLVAKELAALGVVGVIAVLKLRGTV